MNTINVSDVSALIGYHPYKSQESMIKKLRASKSTGCFTYILSLLHNWIFGGMGETIICGETYRDIEDDFVSEFYRDIRNTKVSNNAIMKYIRSNIIMNDSMPDISISKVMDSIFDRNLMMINENTFNDIQELYPPDNDDGNYDPLDIRSVLFADRLILDKIKRMNTGSVNMKYGLLEEEYRSREYKRKQIRIEKRLTMDWKLVGVIDAIDEDGRIVEIKTRVSERTFNITPVYDIIQLKVYLWMLGENEGYLKEYYGGKEKITTIYNDDTEETIIKPLIDILERI